MSYCREDIISNIYASTNSNLKGELSLASTKSELSILLESIYNLSILYRFRFSCIVQLILYDYRVSASRRCLFRLSLLRIVKVIKQSGSFVFS
jgi:hypothetical protein